MLKNLREWSFPVSLLITWLVVAGYTLSAVRRLPWTAGRPAVTAPAQAEQRPSV